MISQNFSYNLHNNNCEKLKIEEYQKELIEKGTNFDDLGEAEKAVILEREQAEKRKGIVMNRYIYKNSIWYDIAPSLGEWKRHWLVESNN